MFHFRHLFCASSSGWVDKPALLSWAHVRREVESGTTRAGEQTRRRWCGAALHGTSGGPWGRPASGPSSAWPPGGPFPPLRRRASRRNRPVSCDSGAVPSKRGVSSCVMVVRQGHGTRCRMARRCTKRSVTTRLGAAGGVTRSRRNARREGVKTIVSSSIRGAKRPHGTNGWTAQQEGKCCSPVVVALDVRAAQAWLPAGCMGTSSEVRTAARHGARQHAPWPRGLPFWAMPRACC